MLLGLDKQPGLPIKEGVSWTPGQGDDAQEHFLLPEDMPIVRRGTPIVIGLCGRRGQGKSLSTTALAKFFKDAGLAHGYDLRILANYYVRFAWRSSPFLFDDLHDFPPWARDALLLIDEIMEIYPRRRSMSRINIAGTGFLRQIRKRGIEVIWNTQFPSQIDSDVLVQTDIFLDVERTHDARHVHCFVFDYWGQWTGRTQRKKWPLDREDVDHDFWLRNVDNVWNDYSTDQVTPPMWAPNRMEVLAQEWTAAFEPASEDGPAGDLSEVVPAQFRQGAAQGTRQQAAGRQPDTPEDQALHTLLLTLLDKRKELAVHTVYYQRFKHATSLPPAVQDFNSFCGWLDMHGWDIERREGGVTRWTARFGA